MRKHGHTCEESPENNWAYAVSLELDGCDPEFNGVFKSTLQKCTFGFDPKPICHRKRWHTETQTLTMALWAFIVVASSYVVFHFY